MFYIWTDDLSHDTAIIAGRNAWVLRLPEVRFGLDLEGSASNFRADKKCLGGYSFAMRGDGLCDRYKSDLYLQPYIEISKAERVFCLKMLGGVAIPAVWVLLIPLNSIQTV